MEQIGRGRRSRECEIRAWLVDRLAQWSSMDPAEIDTGEPFTNLGLTSVAAVSLAGELSEWLELDISPTAAYDHPSVDALASFVAAEAEKCGGPLDAPRIAAIVPVFNEEETLAEVVTALRATPLIDEILIVSDGSTDRTLDVARALGVRGIALPENRGKGLAMACGVAHTKAPILVFIDGDMLNVSGHLVEELIEPVLSERVAMNVGVRNYGPLRPIHARFGPLLSGIRCLRREVFEAVPEPYRAGYLAEIGLNWACRQRGLKFSTTVLYGMKHRSKEQKRGLANGLLNRFRMFGSVLAGWLRLRIQPPDLPAR